MRSKRPVSNTDCAGISQSPVPRPVPRTAAFGGSVLVEGVLVDALDHVRLLVLDADVVADHQPAQGQAVEQDASGRHPVCVVDGLSVVQRGTAKYALSMTHSSGQPTDISVRQFVADSGAVTRGLRQGRAYTLTLNGEPLARMIPIRQRRAVPKEEVLAIFATAPVVDGNELRADLDEAVSQDLRDPYEGTGL
jgi:antitoxin (DNA-binding transcriptional repressor) of toxin-antitoxin stability system